MKRGRISSLLGAAALTAAMAVATPASAGTVGPISCGVASVSGSTEGNGQVTYLTGAGTYHCGNLGVRVLYTHVGGSSWTAYTYSGYGQGSVVQNVGNTARQSQHTASLGAINFYSWR